MNQIYNDLGQPIGPPLDSWTVPERPARTTLEGRFCRLEPLDPESHAAELYEEYSADTRGTIWTYLPYGPFESGTEFETWMRRDCLDDDPLFYAIVELAGGRTAGVASYLRINPSAGSIEVGHINYAPVLQRTAAATEAMYLLMKYAFELGYRRYEWKCDSLNGPSRSAAMRLGFSYEGLFRQATIYKGRSRDTAWYSIIDSEWPQLKAAYERWLEPDNFGPDGRQKVSLSALTAPVIKQRG